MNRRNEATIRSITKYAKDTEKSIIEKAKQVMMIEFIHELASAVLNAECFFDAYTIPYLITKFNAEVYDDYSYGDDEDDFETVLKISYSGITVKTTIFNNWCVIEQYGDDTPRTEYYLYSEADRVVEAIRNFYRKN